MQWSFYPLPHWSLCVISNTLTPVKYIMQVEWRNSLSEKHKHNSWTTAKGKVESVVSPSLIHMRTSHLTWLQTRFLLLKLGLLNKTCRSRPFNSDDALESCVCILINREVIRFRLEDQPLCSVITCLCPTTLLPFCGVGQSAFENTFLLQTGAE